MFLVLILVPICIPAESNVSRGRRSSSSVEAFSAELSSLSFSFSEFFPS